MRRFKTGKVPTEVLVKNVFRYAGSADRTVLLRSSVGEDAAILRIGKRILVLTTDPISSTPSDIGYLSVVVNANDVACRGATPRWFLCDLLLPEGSTPSTVDGIMRQIDRAAKGLRVAVVGGHTEVTPGLKRPIVVGYMAGMAESGRYVTTGGARPGDVIIMTKAIGLEGTAVLAKDFAKKLSVKIGLKAVAKAKGLRRFLSVVDDALIAVRTGGVNALHDPTEGGILQGLWELAEASGIGFRVHEDRITIRPETSLVCSALRVNPLRLMSSGCLLIAARRGYSSRIIRRLKDARIPTAIIGELTVRREGRKLVRLNGKVEEIVPYERDEIYRLIH